MWDYLVTCHPTEVNEPRLNPSQTTGKRFTCLKLMGSAVNLGVSYIPFVLE